MQRPERDPEPETAYDCGPPGLGGPAGLGCSIGLGGTPGLGGSIGLGGPVRVGLHGAQRRFV